MKDFLLGGTVYEAMVLARAGTKVGQAKKWQPSRIDVEGLPWPLTVPWMGSFLTSSNPSRDLVKHGIFADMEVELVSKYRLKLVESCHTIGLLRGEIADFFTSFMDEEFVYPDDLDSPVYYKSQMKEVDTVVHNERLLASHLNYNKQVEEIIKFCGKQSVLLAHPSSDKDSVVVREAFEVFIDVSNCLSDNIS